MYRTYADDPGSRQPGNSAPSGPAAGQPPPPYRAHERAALPLPGTPVIYYGDEIGMGDNVYLGDRDSVRTPMQWSGDRNAGFSTADREQLFLPSSRIPSITSSCERLGPAGQPALAAVVEQAADRTPQEASGVRARRPPDPASGEPPRPGICPQLRRRDDFSWWPTCLVLQPLELDLAQYEGRSRSRCFEDRIEFRRSAGAVSAQPRSARIPLFTLKRFRVEPTWAAPRRPSPTLPATRSRDLLGGGAGCDPGLDPVALGQGPHLVSGPWPTRNVRPYRRPHRVAPGLGWRRVIVLRSATRKANPIRT